MGEIYEKRRYVVAYSNIPDLLKQAFVSAEDASYWKHSGVDPMGILRAMLRNISEGRMSQGASTITQQVARTFLLSREKKIARKIREMILARRIEKSLNKEQILYLYLNQIYLGSGAYGVEAAARTYFDKHVEDLNLSEAAMIAGLPQRPSDYSPHNNFPKAKTRQRYVLEQMVDEGYITTQQADQALAAPLNIVQRTNEFLVTAPYFTEHIRRHLVDTYGFERVYNEGLIATATCDLSLQRVAQQAVSRGVQTADQNFGWRGAETTIKEDEIQTYLATSEKTLCKSEAAEADATGQASPPTQSTLKIGSIYEGVVMDVQKKHGIVGVGRHRVILALSETRWGFKPNPKRSWRYRQLDDMRNALSRGDIVKVKIKALDWRETKPFAKYSEAGTGPFLAGLLYQDPELQGALLSFRLSDGAVQSMVGGRDFSDSEFNRCVQAHRQVGSTFKPFVYTAAIKSRRFTTGTMLQDAPLIMNTLNEKLWKPGNYGEDYMGNITLRKALALSRNVCTVRVLATLGMDAIYEMAKLLGIKSDIDLMDPDCDDATKPCLGLSAGLGASSLTMLELARAYSVFPKLGKLVEPVFIEKVLDRKGNVLEQRDRPGSEQVLEPDVAGIGLWLLREVATSGTGARSNQLGLHLGGKTGTTNDFRDAWFVGFNPDILTAVWVGYDTPRSMGVSSTGGRIALPIWMDYMREAVPKEKDRDFPEIPGVVWAAIDEATGRVAKGGRGMPFLPGTVPSNSDMEVGQKLTEDLLMDDF